jgi:ribosome-associated translation inhibitor RaiA
LRFAVGEFEGQVRDIAVRITDRNGPRGGVDKTCIVAAVVIGGPLLARAAGSNPYTAVDRAAQRLRAQVARQLGRRRNWGGGFRSFHRHVSR